MRPSDTIRATVVLSGAAAGTPTAVLLHNGVVDSAVTPTVVAGALGNAWLVSAAIPATGYAAADTVELAVTATVGAATGTGIYGRSTIDAPATVSLSEVLAAPRVLDGVADNAMTINDGFWAAIVQLGKAAVTGNSYVRKTPAGTTIRTRMLDNPTSPTTLN